MSFSTRTRHLVCSNAVTTASSPLPFLVPCTQRRTLFWSSRKNKDEKKKLPENPLTEENLRRKPKAPPGIVRGDLSPSSIFEDEELAGPKPRSLETKKTDNGRAIVPRNPQVMAAALDPDPSARERWQRKMVIRDIEREGYLSPAEQLKRRERELVSKSHNFKTSVKKLGPLARQIAGKSIEDAIVQMRFSKKKAAKDVRDHLEAVRNEAIVKRGMGLGAVTAEGAEGAEGVKTFTPTPIQTKTGKRITIEDPTSIYIEQAWVGRSDFGRTPDHRARGQINIMKNPTTHITLMVKEEATRIRQHEERQEKLRNRKVWVQMPNRPITAQRQHYSW